MEERLGSVADSVDRGNEEAGEWAGQGRAAPRQAPRCWPWLKAQSSEAGRLGTSTQQDASSRCSQPSFTPPPFHPPRLPPLPSGSFPLPLILRRTQGDMQGGDYDPILQMGKVRPERAGTCSGIPLSHQHVLPQWRSFS